MRPAQPQKVRLSLHGDAVRGHAAGGVEWPSDGQVGKRGWRQDDAALRIDGLLARPRGLEPLTARLEGECSIQLS
ncbi:hypothetical protein CBM2592_A160236 [Cupriavidus taiwanensis]|nr:hypothetical protein CBM2588_A120318 [Cupriavidus taiwanensis]SOY45853.1 hypothetical protein CBM2592_A160236 [Cupriavidus taiwanensis]SOY81311.1 hypothetical protein CBM2591_A190235 [Cupriavidus taiwanensis]SOZ22543.1 hypothetical protein CBM2608_A180006 [Cupriavidus taiwanensis]SOZ54305.1 hypothetical protein CBM2617_A170148 [Cupriavidus taiwanensis]